MPFIEIEREDTSAPIAAMVVGLLAGVFLNGIGVETGWSAGVGLIACFVVWAVCQSSNDRIATRNRDVIHAEEELWRDVRGRLSALELGMQSATRRTNECHLKLFGDPLGDVKIDEEDE